MKKSELLLPCGNMEMCLAAIHGGADAIYVGMPGFNARGRTVDHSVEQLKEIIDICHLYGVHVHVAFNILIFENELPAAVDMLMKVLPLGPDALIIQDLGLAKLVKQISPKQVIHASTQMTVTNHNAMELLEDLDIDRYVLGRENSIKEIKEIRKNTEKELEVFVHGALCVAYSGQCFTSESIGGRSANRGQCAQSCRFSYEMFVDDLPRDLVDQKYIVSPQDLCGINEVKELQDIGIESFKVEGRLKSPTFVGTVAKTYKKALYEGIIQREDVEKMAMSYSRGFFSGWLHGVDHQQLVRGTYQSHRGVYLGKVISTDNRAVYIKTDTKIQKGMGVLICHDEREKELGSSVYNVLYKNDGTIGLELDKSVNLALIDNRFSVYVNSAPEIAKEIDASVKDYAKQKRIPVEITFEAHVGSKATYTIKDCDGNYVEISSEDNLEEAKKAPDEKKIEKDLTSLSRTAYGVENFKMVIGEVKPFLHSKMLKNLRQEAISLLNNKRVSVEEREMTQPLYSKLENKEEAKVNSLNLLIREIGQLKDLQTFLENYAGETKISVILDYEFGKDYHESLDILKSIPNIQSGIATNRILKPGEYHHLNLLTRLKPDFILARNLGAFKYLKDKDSSIRIRGDFSLNTANSQTANYLLEKGFETLTSSYDLNSDQVLALLNNTDASKIEVTTHQYMPSFHMEHCVFAAFLSNGSSFKDCGKPCEHHKVELKDQFGNRHYIKADQECRNTMFNATAQSAASLIPQLKEAGVSQFRVEILDEREEELMAKVLAYVDYLEGETSESELKASIGALEKYGLGSGQLLKQDSYQDRKK
jgi:putative protease